MIGDNLYVYFYETKEKKGINVIDQKVARAYLIVIILMVIFPILTFLSENNLFLTGITIIIFCLFIYFDRRVDILLEEEKRKDIPKSKKKINKFLKKYGVNHSIVYKELASQLEKKSMEQKKIFNLYPQINLILPVAILMLSLLAHDNILEIFLIAIFIAFICLSINPLLNLYSDILFNTKSKRMLRLANLVNEIYLDELIKENYPKANSISGM